ncbi:MAG: CGNR zinc finger domain-containing protein [Actinomycetota bacterium]
MDFTDYSDAAIRVGPDLVNTLGSITGTEYLAAPEDLERFMAERAIQPPPKISEADVETVRRLRDQVRAVFEATEDAEAARLINDLIARAGTQPYLTDHDGHWHLHYTSTDAPAAERLAAVIGMGMAEVIARFGWERFGLCAADPCKDAFIDTSKNRSRRFCSDTCASRANVAAYRARKAAEQHS